MTNHFQLLLATLEFASLPMLGWLAAAAVPWLIHRWRRRQHRTTPWAAVELLLSAMQQRASRVRLEQWLLLAIRTAILVFVALAMAQPALRQWGVGSGDNWQRHRILVIDQSYSMGCQQQGSSRWQRAQAEAGEFIDSSDGDALTLIGWAKPTENLLGRPTFDSSVARAALEALPLLQTSADLPTATRAIIAALERAESEVPHITQHEVVFYTDLGRQTWQVGEAERQQIRELAQRARVTIVNVADERRHNVAVTKLAIDPPITLQQRETAVMATLTCFGEAPQQSVRVELLIEGRRVDSQQVQLRADSETTTRFRHRFVDEGAKTVQVVLADHDDGLASDDGRWLIVDVRPQLRVACLAGRSAAADDLARAVAPGGGQIENAGGMKPEVFAVSRLVELELSNYAAVLLGSVAALSPREVAALTEYVRQGGGLAIFMAQAVTVERPEDLGQLFPVQVESIQPMGDYRFDPKAYRHPIVSPFRGQAQSGLLGVAVSQYCRLQLLPDHGSAEVVFTFDTGDPALVVDRFGLGRVAMFALPGSLAARTASGVPWSSFALSPSFLPVVRELVTYLVGDRWQEQRNLLVGEPAIFPWQGGQRRANVRYPGGGGQTLLLPGAEDRGQMVFRETQHRGVYQFSAGDQQCARFAVNLDGRDGDLRSIDPATLPTEVSTKQRESAATSPMTADDFSFVPLLLGAALVLLLLEIGVAWLLGRGWG